MAFASEQAIHFEPASETPSYLQYGTGEQTERDAIEDPCSAPKSPQVRHIWFWVLLNILSAILQYLTTPLWLGALPTQCADPFVVYQISATMFTFLFLLSVLALQLWNGNDFFLFIRRLTWRGMALIALSGLFGAGNGILVVISSPVQRTPPVITTTFPNVAYIFMILVIWWMHDRRWLPEPKIRMKHFATLEFALFFIMYVLCTYTTVVATNEKAALSGQVYWWLIFLLGMTFGYVANQLQEVFFKTEHFEDSANNFTNYLFCALLMQWIFALLCTWVDFIPGVNLNPSSDVACGYRQTLEYSFRGMGLLWNVLCAAGNYLSYVASVKTNSVNTGLTMLISPISTALVIAISYNFQSLTPDKSLVDVFFFFPMILTSILMIFFYAMWYKGTRLTQDRLLSFLDYINRYEPDQTDESKSVNDSHAW